MFTNTKQITGVTWRYTKTQNKVQVSLGATQNKRHLELRTHHLPDSVEALAVERERLLEQYLVFNGPLVGKGCEVSEIGQCAVDVVLVPEQHAQRLRAHTTSKQSVQGIRFYNDSTAQWPIETVLRLALSTL